jgi:hypothetical protein
MLAASAPTALSCCTVTISLLAGIGLAAAAAGLYALGIALQAFDARDAPAGQALRLSLFRRLVRQPRWLIGTALGLGGWGLQALALTYASLTLVQPALALGLVFLLLIARTLLGEHLHMREGAGVVLIVVAVPLLTWLAPGRSSAEAGGARLWLPLLILGVAALIPYSFRGQARAASVLVPVSAGLAYAWDGIATKLASDHYSAHRWLGLLAWVIAMNVASGVGTLSEMSALQRRPVTQVAPLVFAFTTFVPVALAPMLAGEGWSGRPARVLGLLLALCLVGVGALLVAGSAPVARVLAPRSENAESGTARSPRPLSAPASLPAAASRRALVSASSRTTAPGLSESSPSTPLASTRTAAPTADPPAVRARM